MDKWTEVDEKKWVYEKLNTKPEMAKSNNYLN